MKIAFAVFLFIHGAAHVVGFLSVSGLVDVEDTDGRPSLLLTRFDQSHWLIRLVAVVWLLVFAGYLLAGIGVINEASWAMTAVIAATAVSTVLCVLWYREVPFGFAANVIVVIVLAVPALAERVLP